jgi:hypothetical protein
MRCAGSGLLDKTKFLPQLYGLRPPFRAELVEQPARVRLHSVFADKEFFSNLLVSRAHSIPTIFFSSIQCLVCSTEQCFTDLRKIGVFSDESTRSSDADR